MKLSLKSLSVVLIAALGIPGAAFADSDPMTANAAKAGFAEVLKLKDTAGPRVRPTRTPLRDCGTLPGGCGALQGPYVNLPTKGQMVLDGWDFSGFTLNVNGTARVTCRNCRFGAGGKGQHQLLRIGADSGAGVATFICQACELDYRGATTLNESGVMVRGIAQFADSRFENAPQDFISQIGPASALTITRSYFRKWGQGSTPGAHLEAIHVYSGRFSFTDSFIDGRDGRGPGITSNCTGLLFPNSESIAPGGTTWEVSGNVLLGSKAFGCAAAIQFGSKGGANKGVVRNNLIEPGSSVYVIKDAGSTLEHGGNIGARHGRPTDLDRP